MAKPVPKISRLREIFTLEPENGVLRRKFDGRDSWVKSPDGYLRVSVDGRQSLVHHIIWALHTGAWPKDDIDHINGDGADNRIENLREVPTSVNCKNRKLVKSNTSGWNGVWCQSGRWKAVIRADGVQHYAGSFGCPTAAGFAARKKALELGFHENHGMRR